MVEMLLLGAGASVEAGIPGAFDLTKEISNRIRRNHYTEKLGHVISFVIGGLLFDAGQRNQDPLSGQINVEALFNAVQLLSERNQLEASPFVGSWHSMVDEFDKSLPSSFSSGDLGRRIYEYVAKGIKDAFNELPSSLESRRIDEAIRNAIEQGIRSRSYSFGSSFGVGSAVENYVKEAATKWRARLNSSPFGSSHIESEVAKLIDSRQAEDGQGEIFQQTNAQMIATLRDLVWVQDANKTQHLAPILSVLHSQKRLVVTTLNYDNCVELLATTNDVNCETGIDRWLEAGVFGFGENGLKLLKLHGSIDWVRVESPSMSIRPASEPRPKYSMPQPKFRKASPEEMQKPSFTPAIIFGHRNKLTADGPFLDLLREFREELNRASILTVVGYSFGDPHINVFLSHWLNVSHDHVIRVINGPRFENHRASNSFVGSLLRLRDDYPKQVVVVPKYAGEGLRNLYGEPSEESQVGEPCDFQASE